MAFVAIRTGLLILQRKMKRYKPFACRAANFDRVVCSRNIVTRHFRSRLVPAGPAKPAPPTARFFDSRLDLVISQRPRH
jgi:hypothetical protein